MKITRLILLICLCAHLIYHKQASAQALEPYTYKDVRVGAGGYVSGIIYSRAEKDLLFARTDVGGAYRRNAANKTWVPITDFLTSDDENQSGILSIALDPSDANRVYLATGEYTQSWATTGAIFASNDKGNTWTRKNLTIKLGGNEDGRSAGERLQVDPNKGSILFLGTSTDGLWKSTDYGASWNKVTSFPVSTSTQGSGGISFVLFDKSSTTVAGAATNSIYVGVLQSGTTNFYQSNDAGATWVGVSGASTVYMPFRAALASDGNLFLTYTNGPGPNGITAGAVYKYNTISKVWKTLTPPSGQGAFAGITVDAQNPLNVMISTLDRWSPKDEVCRSIDGGTTWKAVLSTGTLDNSSLPYVGNSPHWLGDIQIDPFDSNNAWFITGYGVYGTTNATVTDNSSGKTVFKFDNEGLEDLVVLGLISPPTGVPLLSAVGDQDGFRHSNLDVSPTQYSPTRGSSTSLDFAQSNPNIIARTYNSSSGNWGSYSLNQGVSWTQFATYPSGTTGGGSIALAADGSRIVWSGSGAAVSYSLNKGTSWAASSGISGTNVIADRVNPLKFYSYDSNLGALKVSTDGGVSFTSKSGLPTLPGYNQWQGLTAAVFGIEDNVWITSGANGLYFTTNAGVNFKKANSVELAYRVVFGKSATEGGYPTVFINGKINNQYGFYRSTDMGNTWLRVNDNQHQFFGVRAFAADPNVFGRFYIGSSGRGIIYGSPTVAGLSGISNENLNSTTGITVYPNPTKGNFTLLYPGNVPSNFTIEIYNLQGKLVFKKASTTAKTELETTLLRGEYLIKVLSDKKLLSTKLLVE